MLWKCVAFLHKDWNSVSLSTGKSLEYTARGWMGDPYRSLPTRHSLWFYTGALKTGCLMNTNNLAVPWLYLPICVTVCNAKCWIPCLNHQATCLTQDNSLLSTWICEKQKAKLIWSNVIIYFRENYLNSFCSSEREMGNSEAWFTLF